MAPSWHRKLSPGWPASTAKAMSRPCWSWPAAISWPLRLFSAEDLRGGAGAQPITGGAQGNGHRQRGGSGRSAGVIPAAGAAAGEAHRAGPARGARSRHPGGGPGDRAVGPAAGAAPSGGQRPGPTGSAHPRRSPRPGREHGLGGLRPLPGSAGAPAATRPAAPRRQAHRGAGPLPAGPGAGRRRAERGPGVVG